MARRLTDRRHGAPTTEVGGSGTVAVDETAVGPGGDPDICEVLVAVSPHLNLRTVWGKVDQNDLVVGQSGIESRRRDGAGVRAVVEAR